MIMADIATHLSSQMSRPGVDNAGLEERFDLDVEFTADGGKSSIG
jgi:uncharacterized protein (TIGR03435 family)